MPTILPVQDLKNSNMIKPFDSKKSQKGTLQDTFDFFEVLGEGSFAKVFRCVDKDSGNSYAAKELDCHGDDEYKAKIEQEVEILKDLRHENIVTLCRSFTEGDKIYLVMELVDGGSLYDEIITQTVYSEKQALRITKQVCKNKNYHEHTFMFRKNLKP